MIINTSPNCSCFLSYMNIKRTLSPRRKASFLQKNLPPLGPIIDRLGQGVGHPEHPGGRAVAAVEESVQFQAGGRDHRADGDGQGDPAQVILQPLNQQSALMQGGDGADHRQAKKTTLEFMKEGSSR